jgi:hypothetical protein
MKNEELKTENVPPTFIILLFFLKMMGLLLPLRTHIVYAWLSSPKQEDGEETVKALFDTELNCLSISRGLAQELQLKLQKTLFPTPIYHANKISQIVPKTTIIRFTTQAREPQPSVQVVPEQTNRSLDMANWCPEQ